jgi:hypothetical protein
MVGHVSQSLKKDRFMTPQIRYFYLLCSLLSFAKIIVTNNDSSCNTLCSTSQNTWQPHAFCASSLREIMLKKTLFENDTKRTDWPGTFGFISEYQHSFGQKCGSGCKSLGAMPFWSGSNTMTYGTNNGESDVDAYQFGMGNIVGQGSISLNVNVTQVATDFMLYFSEHKDARGFFFSMQAPLGALIIDYKTKETVAKNSGNFIGLDAGFTGGVYNNPADGNVDTAWLVYPSPAKRYNSLTNAFQATQQPSSITATLPLGQTIEDQPILNRPIVLEKGKLACKTLTKIGVNDIAITLGYKAYANVRSFVDIGFKVSCPTGNVATAEYMLEPIFGRNGHWGIGGELTSHCYAWKNAEKDCHVDLWLAAELLHLTPGRQPNLRSFDLKTNGAGSKYMLLQYYYGANPIVTSTTPNAPSSNLNPSGMVPSFITQAINVTTLPVLSKFDVEGNLAMMIDMQHQNWNFALGAQAWGRTKEKLEIDDCCTNVNLNNYAVLGRQISEDERNIAVSFTPNYRVLNLYLCEPQATINTSRTTVLATSPGIPFPQSTTALIYPTLPSGIKDARVAQNRIPQDLNDALDIAGACAAPAATGTVLGQVGYTFKKSCYTPNISFFGSAEFAPLDGNSAINMWSVGIQGSLTF